jgi:hypothetical protein
MDSDSLEALRAEINAYFRGQNKTSRSTKTRSKRSRARSTSLDPQSSFRLVPILNGFEIGNMKGKKKKALNKFIYLLFVLSKQNE